MLDRVWRSLQRMIYGTVYPVSMCKEIVRRAGVKVPEASATIPGALPPGGEPWSAITKLSDEDYDVAWRPAFRGPLLEAISLLGSSLQPGAPINARPLTWARLRDSRLRTGVSNDDRFGYALDEAVTKTLSDGGVVTVAAWYERSASDSQDWALYERLPYAEGGDFHLGSELLEAAVPNRGYIRVIAYVTRAAYDYEFVIQRRATGSGFPVDFVFERGTYTGRWVSDWIWYHMDQPEAVADLNIPVTLRIRPTNTETHVLSGVSNWTQEELAYGDGPLCIPFAEVEVKTGYKPGLIYWVQDQYTPEGWEVPEWYRKEQDGPW